MPGGYSFAVLFAVIVLAFPLVSLAALKRTLPEWSDPASHAEISERDPARLFVIAVISAVFGVAFMFFVTWAILLRSWMAAHRLDFALSSALVFLVILAIGCIWLRKKVAADSHAR